jgi:hypothetical protein
LQYNAFLQGRIKTADRNLLKITLKQSRDNLLLVDILVSPSTQLLFILSLLHVYVGSDHHQVIYYTQRDAYDKHCCWLFVSGQTRKREIVGRQTNERLEIIWKETIMDNRNIISILSPQVQKKSAKILDQRLLSL